MMIRYLSDFFQRLCSVDYGFKEPGVSSTGVLFTSRSGVCFNDLVHVAVTPGGQVKELEPVCRRHQGEIVVGDVAHEQKLTCEELAVQRIA